MNFDTEYRTYGENQESRVTKHPPMMGVGSDSGIWPGKVIFIQFSPKRMIRIISTQKFTIIANTMRHTFTEPQA